MDEIGKMNLLNQLKTVKLLKPNWVLFWLNAIDFIGPR